jgi:tRNA(Arg) A34 adenosine deaminase TadA
MTAASESWDALPVPWRLALEAAWTSWCAGSAGVGCSIVDLDGKVIALGRNRLLEEPTRDGPLAGTMMAHAEMDALRQVPFGQQSRVGALYTTFEPCLMCAATITLYRVPVVHYAASDPVFDGLHDWFATFPFTAERTPTRECLGGPFGAFSHVMHLAWLAERAPEHIIDAHRSLAPDHLALAVDVATAGDLRELAKEGGSVVDAAASTWDRITTLAG